MNKKLVEIKKGHVIVFLVCLFIIIGSVLGSLFYGLKPNNPLSAITSSTLNSKRDLYNFVCGCIFPYLIQISSLLTFGVATSLVLILFQSFLSSCVICQAIISNIGNALILKESLCQGLLILACIVSAIFSINKVVNHFSIPSTNRSYLKREKIKNITEHMIILFITTTCVIIYCFLKQNF